MSYGTGRGRMLTMRAPFMIISENFATCRRMAAFEFDDGHDY